MILFLRNFSKCFSIIIFSAVISKTSQRPYFRYIIFFFTKSFGFIGEGVASTYDEALTTRDFLKKNGYESILLVTSKWHSKRAYLTFRSALKNEEVKIVIQPSKYDAFNPDAWWKNKNDAELIFYEYTRLIFYALSFRISPFDIFV